MEDVLAQARTAGTFPTELAEPLLRGADALRSTWPATTIPRRVCSRTLAASLASAVGRSPPSRPSSRNRRPTAPGVRSRCDPRAAGEGRPPARHRRPRQCCTAAGSSTCSATRSGADRRLRRARPAAAGLFGELQDAVIQLRTLPLAAITGPLPARRARPCRRQRQGRRARCSSGAETQLDRTILDGISETIEPPAAQRRRPRDRVARRA